MVDERHPQAGRDYPRNWHELFAWFPDDGACLRFLERLRWREGFVCRFCGAVDGGWWQMADGLRRCAVCRSETSVTAGTIFAGTRTPLTSWFAAVWYVVNQKQGVSALGLQRVLGLGSYRTAWTWLHKLRRAMVRPGRDLLDSVSTDEQKGSGAGLAVQRAAILSECQRRGWHLVDVIEDAGYSAKDLKRPGVRFALELLSQGGADALVVAKLDRLSRSMLDFATIMATATKQHWGLIALGCAVDTTTPAGEAMANVLGVPVLNHLQGPLRTVDGEGVHQRRTRPALRGDRA